jgi:hypothetical protein
MQKVLQTRLGDGGNCLAACIVSILEMHGRLEELSDVMQPAEDWTGQTVLASRWLQHHGWTCIPLVPWDERCEEFIGGCLCIATGISPRERGHAVMWKDGLIHDPHPDGGGLKTHPVEFRILAPLVPVRASNSEEEVVGLGVGGGE